MFFNEISKTYGVNTTRIMKSIMKQKKQLAHIIGKITFLLKCRRSRILPKCLRQNFGNFKHLFDPVAFDKLAKKFLFGLLNAEIESLFKNTVRIKKYITLNTNIVKTQIPQNIIEEFTRHLEQYYEINFKFYKNNLRNKYNSISSDNNSAIETNLKEKWLVNLSDTVLPPKVQATLQLGQKFNLPTTNKQSIINSTICSVEASIHNISEENQINARNSLVNILSNYKYNSSKPSPSDQHLLDSLKTTKKYLKNHPELLVASADKGNVTVIIATEQYNQKMLELLDDSETYIRIKKDKTASTQENANQLISTWERFGFITKNLAKSLRKYNSNPAKLYGLIKIHKPNNPIRPIVSSIGSPTYNMSKFFTNILANIVGKTNSFVKDSFDLKSKINNLIIPDDHKLFSLDVISLFTNIPNDIISEIIDKKWNDIQRYTNLTSIAFKNGLSFVVNNCFFSFKDQHYHQISGSPMGSPVSPVLANLVMEHLEETVLASLSRQPLLYLRYVDDIFCIAKETDIQTIHNSFNSFHEKLQFTIETETDNSIPFLDLTIQRNDNGRLITDWYHKNTWSGRYLNYDSYLPTVYKTNTITILTKRILSLSDPEFHNKNFQLLKTTLTENNYPQHIINRTIKLEKQKFQNPPTLINNPTEETTTQHYISIPYEHRTFDSLKRILKPHNIKLVAKPHNTLYKHTFSKLKDKTDQQLQSNLIYEVPCKDCNQTYIGQTKQYLKKRMYSHRYHINIKDPKHSALVDHSLRLNHSPNFDEVKILDKETNYSKRNILEMIHIKTTDNTMNKQTDSLSLTNSYNSIINKLFQ